MFYRIQTTIEEEIKKGRKNVVNPFNDFDLNYYWILVEKKNLKLKNLNMNLILNISEVL